ncbi:MAG TPA: c-type cytochrome [Steroidobacteraceae bacterium]|nr:c-type cytochrome [Steroidobacteraceae bacterium]
MIARALIGILMIAVIALSLSLVRVERDFAPKPGRPSPAEASVALGTLKPGGDALPTATEPSGYREDAASVSNGQSAYENFNCVGCHQHGGGGIGPALIDDEWIYGSLPMEIYRTISEGRPNGMPAFREKIPETQLWQLVSYVRALGGLVPSVRLPARTDHLQATPPLSLQERQVPTSGSVETEP